MNIGMRLRELREAKTFSQGEIEKRTGLIRCYISRVECGHTIPMLETLEKWAKALDLELYQLFFVGKSRPRAPKQPKLSPVTREGRALLELLEKVNPRHKRVLLSLAREMARRNRD
jgi:transcriptional regulator with XRE-family HTH domain